MSGTTYFDTGDRVVVRESEDRDRDLTIIVNDDRVDLTLAAAENLYEGLRSALIGRGRIETPEYRSR